MKYAAWIFTIVLALYGGIFLMPYKVSAVTPLSASISALFSLVAGCVAGFWLSKPNRRLGITPLFLVGSFFLVSGLLGISFNFATGIEGFPDLALMGSMLGLGLFVFHLAKSGDYAS